MQIGDAVISKSSIHGIRGSDYYSRRRSLRGGVEAVEHGEVGEDVDGDSEHDEEGATEEKHAVTR